MLGRLIDQLLPTHVDCPSEARSASHFISHHPQLRDYSTSSPWGSTLGLLRSTDLLLINLETAVTTHGEKWPDKVFNYRMHPTNIECLKVAGVDYAGLANNHSLDYGEKGLAETVKSIREAGIAFAGAGDSQAEARSPAVLQISTSSNKLHHIHVYAASDHPDEWAGVKQFNHITYQPSTYIRIKADLTRTIYDSFPALKVFSVHWGPNYAWRPSDEIRNLTHHLIDNCDVDIIHGHSSHHVQGVEVYKGKPIIYGCGDFVDDYAVTTEYRNDLSAVWRLHVEDMAVDKGSASTSTVVPAEGAAWRLKPIRLQILPTRIKRFQAELLDPGDSDWAWVTEKIRTLSAEMATHVKVVDGVADSEDMVGRMTRLEIDI